MSLQSRPHVPQFPLPRPGVPLRVSRLLYVVLLGFSLIASPAGAAIFSFDNTAVPVGDNPQGFSVTHCDLDGLPDVVVSGFDADTVTLLTNSGTGQLMHQATVATPSKPIGATCADFTGDGLSDLAVASWVDGTVTIYEAGESGGYTPVGTFDVGAQPRSITSADINVDGKADLVVVNSGSSDLTLLFGTGTGDFNPIADIRLPSTTSNRPRAAAVADFDGNGFPDIAVASQGSPSLRLLLGDGLGFQFFEPQSSLPYAGRLIGIATADYNDDLIPDLALLSAESAGDSAVTLYTGTGTGTFTFDARIPVRESSKAVGLADINDDGLVDLVLSYSDANAVQVVYALAAGRFPSCGVGGGQPFQCPSSPAVNGIGAAQLRIREDANQLVFVDSDTQSIRMLEMVELSGPTISTLLSLEVTPEAVLLADLITDDRDDAIVIQKTGRRQLGLALYPGNAAGGFDLPPPATDTQTCGNGILEGNELCDDGNTKKKDGCSPTCQPEIERQLLLLEAHYINEDLNLDLVMIDLRGNLRILLGDGLGRFPQITTLTTVKRKTTAGIGDFTGDGRVDIAFLPKRARAGKLQILVNDGTGNFEAMAVPLGPGRVRLSGPLLAADVDRNGFTDLVVQNRSKPKGIAVLYSDAEGPLATMATTQIPRGATRLAAADFNEDGWLDILVQFKSRRASPLILFGSPGTALASGVKIPLLNRQDPLIVADIDEDLHHDLVTCGTGGTCRILFGDGAGQFLSSPLPANSSIGRDVRGAYAIDFDGDGDFDVLGISRRDSLGKIRFGGPNPTQLQLETGTKPGALAVADFNGDGLMDIVIANEGSQDVSIFTNAGNRQFNTLVRIKLPTGGSGPVALAVGDVNEDGRLDIAITQGTDPRLTVLLNTVGVGFAAFVNLETGAGPRGVTLANLNGDAQLDIVTANNEADTLSVFMSTPAGGYVRTDIPSGGVEPWDVVALDMMASGFDDIVALNGRTAQGASEGNVVTFHNAADGTGNLIQDAVTVAYGRETPTAMCVGNFNGDAYLDLVVASVGTADISLLHGDGNGGWNGDRRVVPLNEPIATVSCNDADGDGLTDIAFGRRRGSDAGVILTGEIE